MEAKQHLRLAIRDRLSHMNAQERETESRILCRRLTDYLGPLRRTITAYVPFSDEPDMKPLIEEWLRGKWIVALPAIENGALAFRTITHLDQTTKNPITNLVEPLTTNPLIDRTTIDVVIVPGRAFTKEGHRLGRGNGGYDRWIALQRTLNPLTQYVGVCFECQLVDQVPLETHDERMDAVITARGQAR